MIAAASRHVLPWVAVLLSVTLGCVAYDPGERAFPEPPWLGEPIDESDASAGLYHPGAMPTIEIELSEAALDSLREFPRHHVPGHVVIDGVRVENVGVRLKGNYTFRTIDEKASLKIKFDKFIDDQRFRGLERMTLNNAMEDPSYISERLAYRVFREAGLPAPRANSATVAVNGESWGLYVNIEQEDDTFIARWYADASGNLYEAGQTDFAPDTLEVFDLETNEDADDRRDLAGLLVAIADVAEGADWEMTLAPHIETAQFIDFCATEAIVSHWDGYCFSRSGFNNFRFYRDPATERFSFIVSGADVAMKPLLPASLVPSTDRNQLPPYASVGRIFAMCLDDPACEARYDDALDRASASFAATDSHTWALAMVEQIADAAAADPRREHGDDTFELFVDEVLLHARTRVATLAAQRR